MWNLRNKTNEHGRGMEKREANQEIDSTIENKMIVSTGKMGGGMGEIGDGD